MLAMASLEGVFAMAAMVLVISGVLKLRDPVPTTAMLAKVHLPHSTVAAIALGLVEIVAGVAGVVFGGRLAAAAVALLYLGFTSMSLWLVRGDGATDCGCFGSRSAPMTQVHVVLNALMAAIAAAGAIVAVPGLSDIRDELPWAGIPQLGFIILGALLIVALMTVLPETLAAARPESASAPGAVAPFHLVATPVRRSDVAR